MKNTKVVKKEGDNLIGMFKQIFQLKSFMGFIGGGAYLFFTAYSNSNAWERVVSFFYLWILISVVWFIFLVSFYGAELFARLILILKRFIPYSLMAIGYILLLYPPNFQKAIGFIILLIVFPVVKDELISYTLTLFKHKQRNKKTILSKSKLRINKKNINDWVATETNNIQGASYRSPDLDCKKIKEINFTVSHQAGNHWRAGFKFVSENESLFPLVTPESLLFHVYSDPNFNTDQLGIIYYSSANSKQKIITTNKSKVEFKILISKNAIEIKLDNSNITKIKLDKNWLSKLYLVAWGDGNPYRVDFENIEFTMFD